MKTDSHKRYTMFYDNKVEIKKEILYYDVWVTYFGMNLHVVVPKELLREGKSYMDHSKFYIAMDRDGEVYAYYKAPTIEGDGYDATHAFHTNKPLADVGKGGLPVWWKDSLVEYKL